MGHREINQMFQGYRAVYAGVKISKPGSLDFSVGTLYTLELTAFLSFFFFFFSFHFFSFFQIFLVLFYFFYFSLVVIFCSKCVKFILTFHSPIFFTHLFLFSGFNFLSIQAVCKSFFLVSRYLSIFSF